MNPNEFAAALAAFALAHPLRAIATVTAIEFSLWYAQSRKPVPR